MPRFKRTGKRNEIFIASKFGAGSSSGKTIDGSPTYVKEACQKSLEKLGVDQIDLYYAHRYGIHDQSMPMNWMSNAVAIKKGGSYRSHRTHSWRIGRACKVGGLIQWLYSVTTESFAGKAKSSTSAFANATVTHCVVHTKSTR